MSSVVFQLYVLYFLMWSTHSLLFCYGERGESGGCNAKDGNPFGPFWDTFGIDFDESVFYQPLHYDIHYHNMANKWNESIQDANESPFNLKILVNGESYSYASEVKACDHVEHSPLLFAAPQCLGYLNEHGKATHELCFPTKEIILKQLRRVVKALRARSVFVASDNNHMIEDIEKGLKDLKQLNLDLNITSIKRPPLGATNFLLEWSMVALRRFYYNWSAKVKAYTLPESEPHVDLAILGLSNHFIGNCISSFSAFVKRERDVNNLQSSFWAID